MELGDRNALFQHKLFHDSTIPPAHSFHTRQSAPLVVLCISTETLRNKINQGKVLLSTQQRYSRQQPLPEPLPARAISIHPAAAASRRRHGNPGCWGRPGRAGPGRSSQPLGITQTFSASLLSLSLSLLFFPHRFAKGNFSKQELLKYLSHSFFYAALQKAQTGSVYGQKRKCKKSVQIC